MKKTSKRNLFKVKSEPLVRDVATVAIGNVTNDTEPRPPAESKPQLFSQVKPKPPAKPQGRAAQGKGKLWPTIPGIKDIPSKLCETPRGVPKPVDPHYEDPQGKEAQRQREQRDEQAKPEHILEDQLVNPDEDDWNPRPATRREDRKDDRMDRELSETDWHLVHQSFAKTGYPAVIAKETNLKISQVEYLLTQGIKRLGLPGVRDYAVDKAQVNIKLQEERQKQTQLMVQPNTQQAIQERVVQEATAAQRLLQQTVEAGDIVGDYVNQLMTSLKVGNTMMAIPPVLTASMLETLTKVIDAHSRATERAVKTVRLTAGEPTDIVEHQIGVLLAGCTTEELLEAEKTGALPKRLISRLGGSADPIQASAQALPVSTADNQPIDVDFSMVEDFVSNEGKLDEHE